MKENVKENCKIEVTKASLCGNETISKPPIQKPSAQRFKMPLPYTFDPKAILQEMTNPKVNRESNFRHSSQSRGRYHHSINSNDYPIKPNNISMRESLEKLNYKLNNSHAEILPKQHKHTESLNSSNDEVSQLMKKSDHDTKNSFHEVFNSTIDTAEVSNKLIECNKNLDSLLKKLTSPNTDKVLSKNNFGHEITELQNDLRIAQSSISELIKERDYLKNQLELRYAKTKKLTTACKVLQDHIKTYLS